MIFLSPCRFQSTFPRGERQDPSERQAAIAQFQSTFPRGERQSGNLYLLPDRGFQSTFPRGERLLGKFIVPGHYHFNPRSLVGNDGIQQAINADTVAFQSTFPRGERPIAKQFVIDSGDFNPRSLVGNDGKFSQIFFVFLCNKYNFSTFYYPFSLFFSVIHVTFLIFVVRILPAFYVYF